VARASIIVESSCAPRGAHDLTLLPRARRRRGWDAIDLEPAIRLVSEAPSPRVLIAPGPHAGVTASVSADVARVAGADLVRAPEGPELAPLVVGLGARWAREGLGDLAPRLQALTSALARPCTAQILVRLRPRTLAAWTRRVAARCAWCRSGHGYPGAACGRCGAPIR